MGLSFDAVRERPVTTLSGGEQKRLVLEALLRGPDEVLLLDEPDNYLDVAGKQWLEDRLAATSKTVLLVSTTGGSSRTWPTASSPWRDRGVWIHGGGFATYASARADRIDRLEERRRRWDEEHAKLRQLVHMLRQTSANNDALSSAYRAARSRLGRFEQAGPPERAPKAAERPHPAARRPDRQTRRLLRGPGAGRSDGTVRHRDLVRRTGGRPRLQQVGQSPRSSRWWRRRTGRCPLAVRHTGTVRLEGAGGSRPVRRDRAPRPDLHRAQAGPIWS